MADIEIGSKTFTVTDYPFAPHLHRSKDLHLKGAAALEWLRTFGGSVHADRYHSYAKEIDGFGVRAELDDAEVEMHSFLNAHSEMNELIRIHEVMQSIDSGEYVAKLRKISSGQAFRNRAVNEPSRDFLFELSVAARFLRAGYEITLNEVADSIAFVDGRRIYVEAKRIKSVRQVGKRISEANKQIYKRLSQDHSSKSRGLIAASLTDVLNPDNNMVIIEDVEMMRKNNSDVLHAFVAGCEEFKKGSTNKCMGVFAEFTMQGMIYQKDSSQQEQVILANCRVGTFRRYNSQDSNSELLRNMLPKLSNQSFWK